MLLIAPMAFIAVLLVFAISTMFTNAVAHERWRWRCAAAIMLLAATLLATWTARLVASGFAYVGVDLQPTIAWLIGALPYAVVLARSWIHRRQTPLHTPSLNDDPVMRRYLAEKVRRRRLRRQAEALEEAADDSSTP